jgi:hypothetical protein
MKLAFYLGVFGPWQLIALLVFFGLIIGLVLLIISLARKSAAKKLLAPLSPHQLDQLERLNKLKQSGALSEVEYEIEKRKILTKF